MLAQHPYSWNTKTFVKPHRTLVLNSPTVLAILLSRIGLVSGVRNLDLPPLDNGSAGNVITNTIMCFGST
jgi:hypothetical protein